MPEVLGADVAAHHGVGENRQRGAQHLTDDEDQRISKDTLLGKIF